MSAFGPIASFRCAAEVGRYRRIADSGVRAARQIYRKREAERLALEANKTDIGWGHQIRSYVLQPYQMVKDLRTNVERSDPQKVLDGDLDEFMAASLAARVGEGGKEAA